MMNTPKMICFDMDGTIADLYRVNNWEPMLRAEKPDPFLLAEPMWDMVELREVLQELQQVGVEIRIVTWLSMNSTEPYKEVVREAKRQWLAEQNFPYDHFHGIQYGTPKANTVRKYLNQEETAILIDDNAAVRKSWHLGETVDPTTCNIVDFLRSLL